MDLVLLFHISSVFFLRENWSISPWIMIELQLWSLNYNWHLNLKYCGALSLDANCNGLLIQGQKLQFNHSSGTIAPIYSSPFFLYQIDIKENGAQHHPRRILLPCSQHKKSALGGLCDTSHLVQYLWVWFVKLTLIFCSPVGFYCREIMKMKSCVVCLSQQIIYT